MTIGIGMKIQQNEPPREFEVGYGPTIVMKDCAHIQLEADEQVTFKTEAGGELDVARKDWGFYATPSVNGRLERFGLQTVLVKNRNGQFFILLVERGCEARFEQYVQDEGLDVCGWLDENALLVVERALKNVEHANSAS